jgi:hypothetical protein
VTDWAAKGSAWLLFAAVAGAPIPFGSSDPVVIAFWCCILGLALILAPVTTLKFRQIALLALGMAIAAAYAFVLHEQIALQPWLSIATPVGLYSAVYALLRTRDAIGRIFVACHGTCGRHGQGPRPPVAAGHCLVRRLPCYIWNRPAAE